MGGGGGGGLGVRWDEFCLYQWSEDIPMLTLLVLAQRHSESRKYGLCDVALLPSNLPT